jgi:hypothetical protein
MQSVEQFLHLSSDTISSLIDLNLRVHRSLDLNKVLAEIIDRAGSLARSEANRLFLVEHQTGILQGVFPDAREERLRSIANTKEAAELPAGRPTTMHW